MLPDFPPDCCVEEPPAGPFDDEQYAMIAKALGHPARIAILRSFRECRPYTAGEIVAELPLAQSTVSEHLRILRTAGLLSATEDPPRTWYCVRRGVLEQFVEQGRDLLDPAHAAPDGGERDPG